MVMVVMATRSIGSIIPTGAASRFCQILEVRQLTGLRCRREVGRKLGELGRSAGIPISCSGLRRGRQIRRNGLGDLLILGWVGLLQLLERARQLRERRKLAVVRLVREWCEGACAKSIAALIGGHTVALEGAFENRL